MNGRDRISRFRRSVAAFALAFTTAAPSAWAASQDPLLRVTFNGRPVPGATVTAARGDRRVTTTSDEDGLVRTSGLDPGVWTFTVDMTGFEPVARQIVVPTEGLPPAFELTLRPIDTVMNNSRARAEETAPATAVSRPPPDTARRPLIIPEPRHEANAGAADGFVINGSVNNAAASPFAQPRGFGNNRPQAGTVYSGHVGLAGGTSWWDARPYSFIGSQTPKPAYADLQVGASLGGPVKPWRGDGRAPRFFVAYQGSSRQRATTESLRVPTGRERTGDFSSAADARGAPIVVIDPRTGAPFPGNIVPLNRISPQAAALLRLYPIANDATSGRFNYDAAVTSVVRQDDVQARVTHAIPRNVLLGTITAQRADTRTRTALGFEDVSRTSGLDALASWNRRFRQRFGMRFRYQYTRTGSEALPHFAGRTNVSNEAGVAGNDQSPANWGPPRLVFPDVAALGDVAMSSARTSTHGVNVEAYVTRPRHTITIGGEARLHRQHLVYQEDARGTFTFTGAATGVPFADFLLGLPTTSGIGVGNPEKNLQSKSFDLYVSDDARIRPTVTLTIGARWEYEAPFTESFGRMANLDSAPGFTAVQAVTSSNPRGPLTGRRYPAALVTSDYSGIQPRVAVSWRPIAGSSLTIRAGFGVYRNAGLYAALARPLAAQPPFSRTALVERSAGTPITLAHGFAEDDEIAHGTFAVDPDIRVGYQRTWQASAVRDLPRSLQLTVSYLGSHGRRLLQQIRPNTYPPGGTDPCRPCPSGFVYLTSTGRASRHALQVGLRRRLHRGLAATVQYTLARAFDDAATFSGGIPPAHAVAQDWRNPGAEWSPSDFDRRHTATIEFQYTTGAGLRHGTGGGRWIGTLLHGWTFSGDMALGSALPFTPIYLAAIPGSGFVGLRPNVTGAPMPADNGSYADPGAFTAPAPGAWGTAGRNSVRGPAEFRFDMVLSRTFAWGDRRLIEWRIDATNVLNRVTFAGLHTIVGTASFGQPSVANPQRKIEAGLRVRF